MQQEELDDRRALVDERPLPVVDLVVALRPDHLRDEVVDPDDEDVLVVRAVEDRDLALGRRRAGGPATGSRGRARRRSGTLKTVTGQPCGLKAYMTWRIVPSLPAASMPWRTIRTGCFCLGPDPVLEVGQPLQSARRSGPRTTPCRGRRSRSDRASASRTATAGLDPEQRRAGRAVRASAPSSAGLRAADRRPRTSLYDRNVPHRSPAR